MSEKTSKKGTDTSEGFIPHLKTGNLRCPVKLDFSKEKIEGLYPPLKENDHLVYAVPGSGTFP